ASVETSAAFLRGPARTRVVAAGRRAGCGAERAARTHPMLNRISLDEVSNEIIQSRDDLEREVGETLPVFAYPSGGVTDEVVQVVEGAGFRLAFTTQRGVNNLEKQHRLRIKRINVGLSTTIPMLRAQCLPSVRRV
ncbi:MAG: polysaccharide deacetylase family protein, partial [Chloroflexi bacterium]|nr:polysaccharide deacetylase family protein [Chloroflexota bacterium]